MGRYKELKKLVRDFTDLQDNLAQYGAADTEPDVVFQRVLRRSVEGVDFLPTTADDWQFYSDIPGVDEAAFKLTETADKIRSFIRETTIAESLEIRNFIEGYCWRC